MLPILVLAASTLALGAALPPFGDDLAIEPRSEEGRNFDYGNYYSWPPPPPPQTSVQVRSNTETSSLQPSLNNRSAFGLTEYSNSVPPLTSGPDINLGTAPRAGRSQGPALVPLEHLEAIHAERSQSRTLSQYGPSLASYSLQRTHKHIGRPSQTAQLMQDSTPSAQAGAQFQAASSSQSGPQQPQDMKSQPGARIQQGNPELHGRPRARTAEIAPPELMAPIPEMIFSLRPPYPDGDRRVERSLDDIIASSQNRGMWGEQLRDFIYERKLIPGDCRPSPYVIRFEAPRRVCAEFPTIAFFNWVTHRCIELYSHAKKNYLHSNMASDKDGKVDCYARTEYFPYVDREILEHSSLKFFTTVQPETQVYPRKMYDDAIMGRS